MDSKFPLIKWGIIEDKESKVMWDENLVKFNDYSIYQTFDWGESKRALGWIVCRLAAFDNNNGIVAMMQGFVRRYAGKVGMVWTPGGPIGNVSAWNDNLRMTVAGATELRWLSFRIYSNKIYNAEESLILRTNGWKRPLVSLNSGLSLFFPIETSGKKYSKNWRHNLNRSKKYGLTVGQWKYPDIQEIYSLYASMQQFKQIKEQYSLDELGKIFAHLGHSIVLYRCDNEKGKLIAFRGYATVGTKAWDIFAATSEEGRKKYASYVLFDTLMEDCRRRGIEHYDMGGVDPTSNRGVYDFKRGTGAVPIEYLGEWECASPDWLRVTGNCIIRCKRGAL